MNSPLSRPLQIAADEDAKPKARRKTGERRAEILQALAHMLELGDARVTTAVLAARLDVSEAALYRHFASKAQMYEGLIESIEQGVQFNVDEAVRRGISGPALAQVIVERLLHFGEHNRGLSRVMVGDALVYEHERLIQRMNLFFDRIENSLASALRSDEPGSDEKAAHLDAATRASVLLAFAIGRLQRYVRSAFGKKPTDELQLAFRLLEPAPLAN